MAEIALFLYDGMTALDAVGPYEVLARLPDAQIKFVASTPGPKKTDVGLVLTADSSLDDVPTPDIIVIPGSGKVPFLEDPAAVEWVRRAHETSKWTTSVCTGSMLLGAAGILQGKRATSHWAVRDYLRNFGAEPVAERVVIEGKVITAGGVSAGIDMALTLAAREAGEDEARALQLVIEYDPSHPSTRGRWRRPIRRPSSAQPKCSPEAWPKPPRRPWLVSSDSGRPDQGSHPSSTSFSIRPRTGRADDGNPGAEDGGVRALPRVHAAGSGRSAAGLRQPAAVQRPIPAVVVAERLEPMATDGPLKVIAAADTTPVVGSVCTGALVLAAAGLLEGRQAATHWAYHRLLERLGATYLPKRWVEDGKFITSAGVSAGIDMALALVARLTDEPTVRMVQVAIQYDPTRRSGASTGTRWTETSTSRCSAPWSNSS
jgi:transcriptional regulator GlxA family with amidase domain